jgi:hypothetical protein
MSAAQRSLGHLDFGHSILFRISYFVLRILGFMEKRPTHSYGVLPQSPLLWAGIIYFFHLDISKPTLEVSTMLFATHNVEDLNQQLVSPALNFLKGFGADNIHFINSLYNRFGC